MKNNDIIITGFMDGMSISRLAEFYEIDGDEVENIIRSQLKYESVYWDRCGEVDKEADRAIDELVEKKIENSYKTEL